MLLSGQPCCPEKGQVPTCVLVPSAPASGRSSESYPSLRCVPLAHAAVAQVRSCRRGMCIWCLMTKPLGLAAVTAVPFNGSAGARLDSPSPHPDSVSKPVCLPGAKEPCWRNDFLLLLQFLLPDYW